MDPDVVAAVRGGGACGRVALAYVEWAGARRQVVVVDWMVIDGPAAAALAAGRLLTAPRIVHGVNAIGAAIVHGVGLIETNGFAGDRKIIDLSGDSAWNPRRPTLAEARAAAEAAGVAINALAILCDNCSGRQGAVTLNSVLTPAAAVPRVNHVPQTASRPEFFSSLLISHATRHKSSVDAFTALALLSAHQKIGPHDMRLDLARDAERAHEAVRGVIVASWAKGL